MICVLLPCVWLPDNPWPYDALRLVVGQYVAEMRVCVSGFRPMYGRYGTLWLNTGQSLAGMTSRRRHFPRTGILWVPCAMHIFLVSM